MTNYYNYPQPQMNYQPAPYNAQTYSAPQYSPAPYQTPYPNSYYAPPPQPQMAQPVKRYNESVKYTFENKNGQRHIVLHNVELPHELDVTSSTLSFKRGDPDHRGKMRFSFKPDGEEHVVSINNYNRPVYTFKLKPKLPEVKFFKEGGKKMLVSNLYNPRSLRLASDNPITWNLVGNNKEDSSYVLNFDPQNKVHNIELSTVSKRNGKKTLLKNGKITLAPKNKPVEKPPMYQPYPSAPMGYASPPGYYQPYAPPPYQQAPPPYQQAPPPYQQSPPAYYPSPAGSQAPPPYSAHENKYTPYATNKQTPPMAPYQAPLRSSRSHAIRN